MSSKSLMMSGRILSLKVEQSQAEPQISSVTLAARKAESRKLLPVLQPELSLSDFPSTKMSL
jgi:hypothetical protein